MYKTISSSNIGILLLVVAAVLASTGIQASEPTGTLKDMEHVVLFM